EVILGSKKDPGFGPVILFGAGGIMTELFHDRAIGLPPLNRLLARRLIEETKIYKLLKGFRNLPPANLSLLEEILVRLSQLVIDLPEIVELDINPTILSANWAYAVDARAVLAPADKPSPLHLAVSAYPEELEMRVTTKSGRKLFIRPIRPEDAPLLSDLLKSLSQETIYHRFLRQVQVLDPEVIARLTQVDYDRELALVALDESGPRPVMVAVHRFMGHPDGEAAEAAIGVGDAWQGLGIGALLMETGIRIARKRGFKRLFGYCLPGNEGMLGLAQQMGMETTPVEEGRKILLTLDLTKAER
ncbi:MAG: GNAT family N-acetyltransferase, partial [Thermodesulfobacteriota bacterium]